jgi:hypothetical protein
MCVGMGTASDAPDLVSSLEEYLKTYTTRSSAPNEAQVDEMKRIRGLLKQLDRVTDASPERYPLGDSSARKSKKKS